MAVIPASPEPRLGNAALSGVLERTHPPPRRSRHARKQDLLLASDALRANAQVRLQGLASLSSTRLAARWTLTTLRALRQPPPGSTHPSGQPGVGQPAHSAWALWAGALALEWLPASLPRLLSIAGPHLLRWAGPVLTARWRHKL